MSNSKFKKIFCAIFFQVIISISGILGQDCQYFDNEDISFTSEYQGEIEYENTYLLTDYKGEIIQISFSTVFQKVKSGRYTIYGINYSKDSGSASSIVVGGKIQDIVGQCFDVSIPYFINVCPKEATCSTENGTYTFNASESNPDNPNVFVLSNLNLEIVEISNINTFRKIGSGYFYIFGINYASSITGLDVGSKISDITGDCFQIGNPLLIRGCFPCQISLGEDINICAGDELVLTSSVALGVQGSYIWNTGEITSSIRVSPHITTEYFVKFTSADGCVSSDTISLNVTNIKVSVGDDVESCLGSDVTLAVSSNFENTIFNWSTGETTNRIKVIANSNVDITVRGMYNECVHSDTISIKVVPCDFCSKYNCDSPFKICKGDFEFKSYDFNSELKNIYVLVDINGIIVDSTTQLSFPLLTEGRYFIFGINYKEILINLKVGNYLSTIYGSCYEISEDPLVVDVYDCDILCNACEGVVSFNSTDFTQEYITKYILLDSTGIIVSISDSTSFLNVNSGKYLIFGLNIKPTSNFEGLEIGENISNFRADCFELSKIPYIVKVCSIPSFTITGKDTVCLGEIIRLSATSGFAKYFWSTGETTSTIEKIVNSDLEFTVTVTNSFGCSSIKKFNVIVSTCSSLGDYVWEDSNLNGIQDKGELGIKGVLVRLFNQSGVQIASRITDSFGFYNFSNLSPNIYSIKFENPIGYFPTLKIENSDDALNSDPNSIGLVSEIVLKSGENNLNIDAGFYRLAQIGNFVWEDKNANGVQDPFESGIANVNVSLTGIDAFGTFVNLSTDTDENGLYQFKNLVPGIYTLTFIKPDEIYKISPNNAVEDDARDSDANIFTGVVASLELKSGESNQTIDAGFYKCASVGDFVWLDLNNNEYQDLNDEGLNDVLVELYRVGNPYPVQSTRTTNDPRIGKEVNKGFYRFEVCALGEYIIKVRPDVNIYQFVNSNRGIDDTVDSDISDIIDQSTLPFTVNYGAQITNIDAGVRFGPLPVTLKSFDGWWDNVREANLLKWETVSETNCDYFEIERSFNGSAYDVIAKVAGAGNSAQHLAYEVTDFDIFVNGVYTYRLKQADYDGRSTFFNPINILIERALKGAFIAIYPNPSLGDFSVEIEAKEGQSIKADLYDSTGKLISQKLIGRVMTDMVVRYQNDNMTLDKGLYYIVINIDGIITSKPLIITK